MAVGDVSHDAIDGQWITDSLGSGIYTVPDSPNRIALYITLYFANQDTADRMLEVQIVESGGSTGATKRTVYTQPGTHLQPGEHREYTFADLLTGAKVYVLSDVTDKLSVRGAITLKEV